MEDLAAHSLRNVGGIFGDIWHNGLEVALNFTTDLNPSVDGTWNGLVTGLAENRTQIALTALYITPVRSLEIDFSPPIDNLKERIFIKNRNKAESWTTYVDPFEFSVWIAFVAMLSLVIILLSFTYHFGPEKYLNPNSFTIQNTWLIILGSQLIQGS